MAGNIFRSMPSTGDILGAGVQGYADGSAISNDITSTVANRRAAPMIANGDFGGAAKTYGAFGMADEARSNVADQQTMNDRAAKQQKEAAEQRLQGLLRMTHAVETAPEGQRLPALQRALTLAQQFGVPADHFAEIQSEGQLSDAALAPWKAMLGEQAHKLELLKGEDGQVDAWDGQNLRTIRKGTPKPFAMDPTKTYVLPDNGAPAGAASPPAAGANNFDDVIGPLLQREGGYVGRDGRSGAPANFGINQRANPDIDVKNLTADQAKSLYRERYWNAINADQLPPEARPAVFDAAVNQGPETALRLWQQSGGDLDKFNQLRLARYRSTPGYDESGKAWEARVAETGGQGQPMRGGAGSDALAPSQAPPGYRVIQAARPVATDHWVDLPGGGQRNERTGETKNVPNPKPGKLSATALNQQNEHLGALQIASAVNTRLAKAVTQLGDGSLQLGPVKNLFSGAQNAVGLGSSTSHNYASFRADLEKLRNDSLRLNKGVQTEGDAERAWKEVVSNLNDPELVKQRLQEIEGYNQQAIAFHRDMVEQVREDSGMPPIDTTKFLAKPIQKPTRPPLTSFQR